MDRDWKVGELAGETGISVRTLHHYDEIGLLVPSRRSEGGHRVYSSDDVIRLQHIKSLQQLGMSLEDIRRCLDGPDVSPRRIVAMHLERVTEQIELQRRVQSRLESLARAFDRQEPVAIDQFIKTIEVIAMFEKYYTEEQMQELSAHAEAIGPEKIRQAEREWPKLIADMRAEMEKKSDPASPRVQALAKRWAELVNAFTGGNPRIESSLRNLYKGEPQFAQEQGLDKALFEYVGKAMKAGA